METHGWIAELEGAVSGVYREALALLPEILTAVALLVTGWIAGRILRWLVTRLITRLGQIRTARAIRRAVRGAFVDMIVKEVIGRIVFWTVFVFFAASAGDVLGLSVASGGLSLLVRYLPSVLAAVVIVFVGVVLGNLARNAIATYLEATGVSGRLPGEMVRYSIAFIALVVAVDQIGIDSTLLILAAAILLAAGFGSVALAVGLGARLEVGNLIALHYASRAYAVGQRVRIHDIEGTIVEFRLNGVLLDTGRGRALVPATEFSRAVSWAVREAA